MEEFSTPPFTRISTTLIFGILAAGCIHRRFEIWSCPTDSSFHRAARFIVAEKDHFVSLSLLNLLYALGQAECLRQHVVHALPLSYFAAIAIVWAFPFTLLGAAFDTLVVLQCCSPKFKATSSVVKLKFANAAVFQTRSGLKYAAMLGCCVVAMMFHAAVLRRRDCEAAAVVKEIYNVYSVLCYIWVIGVLAVFVHVKAWYGLNSLQESMDDATVDTHQRNMMMTVK